MRRQPSGHLSDPPERVGTLVVGGGQAGLAVGHHLRARDRSFAILDAHDRVGDAWRTRWDSLRLFTPARSDALPGMRFPAGAGHYPSKDEVADYLEHYAATFDLPVHTGVRVHSAEQRPGGFEVGHDRGTTVADTLVVATGFGSRPHVPPVARELAPSILQLHSADYRGPQQLPPGDVLVVGTGNSGADIALEVARSGRRTTISGRDVGQSRSRAGSTIDRHLTSRTDRAITPHLLHVRWPWGRRLRDATLHPPSGTPRRRVFREDLAAVGVEWVSRVVASDAGLPRLLRGETLAPSSIIWCTGFRRDDGWIHPRPATRDGVPEHDRGVSRSVDGLYFVGLRYQSSPTSHLLGGVGRDARHVVEQIERRATSRPPRSPSRPGQRPTVAGR